MRFVSCIRLVWIYCRVSQPLWRPNVPEYFLWLELNGLFVFSAQKTHFRIQPEFCLLISCVGYKLTQPLFTCKQSPALHIHTIFHSKTRFKLKSRLGYELLHSALQPTFPTDNKELFFCITFLPLWPNLAPCSAFSQHTSIISALFHCDQIWHILPENPQL